MSNNIQRTVSVFRPFLNNDTSLPLAKPRFIIDGGGELRLRANPLPTMAAYQRLLDDEATVLEELGEHDYFFQRMLSGRLDFLASVRLAKVARQMVLDTYSAGSIIRSGVYNVDSEAFAVTTRVLEAFYRQVENDGAAPLILVFPVSRDIDRKRAGRTASYRPLLDFCERQALRCVDFMDAFVRYGESREVADFLQSDGHYSRLGNEIVAQGLRDQLRDVPVPGPAR